MLEIEQECLTNNGVIFNEIVIVIITNGIFEVIDFVIITTFSVNFAVVVIMIINNAYGL